MSRARYIMIGGFLGAGKTTSVAALAQHLTDAGRTVGLITNDQGRELVDTAMLRAKGFATEEIPGGCFCCRFNSLVDAANKLTEQSRPDVFIAEPVGSCTDLVATVTYPLRRMYGEKFSIAPLSVLVDPIRASRIFGLSEGGNFPRRSFTFTGSNSRKPTSLSSTRPICWNPRPSSLCATSWPRNSPMPKCYKFPPETMKDWTTGLPASPMLNKSPAP